MTLKEAIEENQQTLCVPNSEFLKLKYRAIALGNEALKRLEKARKERRYDRLGLLPGETG